MGAPSTQLRIAIAGASGRMGKMLVEAVLAAPDCELAAALVPAGEALIGQDAGAFLGQTTGVLVQADTQQALAASKAQYLIDFTRPEGSMAHVQSCAALGIKMVIGTTGFSESQKQEIAAAAQKIALVLSPNMSVGVNVTYKLLELATKALQPGYDIEVIEAHHRHKVDAPSGTAIGMGEVIARTLGQPLEDIAVYERYGHTGERKPGSIGFATIRGGDIVGDHTVMYAGTGERIEISHKSSSRATYAQGSLRAVRYLAQKTAGLYDMQDVLGLK
ncbi:4-hydroxy-tetrahydrodipicolinate reductase [Saezia sanguinis]|uniref:4-hydroxy-tetrahydrodipicolinate reductase n=1 Tax=Saezia sanguinis TaxID=1965230 RepID=A0A433SE79_9BURK|nr:4-hydroxy-tetrahydrodipicolinate reductase [Saezia sanguinis]RUS67047.1 4-hydroxy-tetrahydrodipicolinate reductase [Saezia sanguinis]